MITLCGFALSNYYNKVKLALLEKGLHFSEENVRTGSTEEAVLRDSPLAKIPFLRSERGALCESQAIIEYLEVLQPEPALLPADPFEAAKVREIATFLDWHLEMTARELYPQAFFGGQVSAATKERVRQRLQRNLAAFKRLAKFTPFVAGETFTLADCAAIPHLPLVALSSKIVLGEDLVAAAGIDWKAYLKASADRPSVQRVSADRKLAEQEFAAARASKPAA